MNTIDRLIHGFDGLLRTVARVKPEPQLPSPSRGALVDPMTDDEIRVSGGLMRVNHTGEICAQGLYNGQALFASDEATGTALAKAAEEELDHLAWCRERLHELNAKPSILDPLWYSVSFALGAGAALVSDKVSLGFVHATEENVERHLRDHLQRLPASDHASRQILQQMLDDEIRHGQTALDQGGQQLPTPVRRMMWEGAKLMTQTAERV
ncbi:MAG: 2-polyprenyl-3-methyl-6-methoxy-1,4-benzoquinone monooxygenase [Litoricola sp.]|nr:2-polyprenyl-3-methyl-6-methoxy-1,4-benzoquinone monooxygenase [Litorivicinus sp.]MCH1501522.1 2-polyprenyl-3-methyl-6-methoxy-1,4-benzoquinone monooxygenase [Litorivicinaceae bacterium]HAB67728.1 demethoxyubiquinone hydroxylase family protein [Gammaproteobacteria bacterium]MBL6809879.1 2-polyprenyl-3-methyl-6-methoxy-1,4-benzoquinone monooxygenase [Litorivicinus sp.]MBL6824668.1 2-polyprenyl-3-methyl-6-methoxy-1,4-benzoquinone monooxygenase [Litorivicinus sp.]